MVPAIYEVQDDRCATAKAQKHQAAAGTQKQQAAQADKRASGPQKGKGKEIRATSISDAQIDPTLLTGEDSMATMNNVNQTTHNNSGEFIQESDMQLLMNNGYPSHIGTLHCTEWFDSQNDYSVPNHSGSRGPVNP
jgi:hypothetical protein